MKNLLSLLCVFLLTLMPTFGCSSGVAEPTPSVTSEALAPLSCSTDAQCKGVQQYQAGNCAKLSTGTCRTDHICNYQLDTSNTACHCIVGEERKCAPGGFQTCFQNTYGGDWPNGGCDASYDNYTSTSEAEACTSTLSCTDGYIPACADFNTIGCSTAGPAGRQCYWNLVAIADEPDCLCVDGEVRDCYKYNGSTGHQTCYLTTASSTNDWGHPTAWTSCF